MPLTEERILKIFKGLENGDGAAFFESVSDDVDWTVMGTHPLAGHYLCKKAFREGTFSKLGQVLKGGAQLHVNHLFVKGNQAIVELHSLATARNGIVSITITAGLSVFWARRLFAYVPTLTRRRWPSSSREIRFNNRQGSSD